MIYNKVLSANDVGIEIVMDIYQTSFPIDERREIDALKYMIDNEDAFTLEAIYDNDTIVGLLSWWNLGEWRYIEHFAVDEQCRGRGIGQKVLMEFLARNMLPVVLEVEPPVDEFCRRRISFYRTIGFRLHDTYSYTQPPYCRGRNSVELCLMSYNAPALYSLDEVAGLLHRNVYGVK